MDDISEYVLLVQLMDSLDTVNNAVSVVGKCIFDSNYENALSSTIESLNLIYSCSDEDQTVAIFDEVYYAVRYFNPK